MDQANSPSNEPGLSNRQTLNLLLGIMHVWTISLEVFLRRGFGHRYPGMGAVFVLPLICVYSLGWAEHDLRPLFGFMLLYLLMCFRHRMAALLCPKDCQPLHSRYTGLSQLYKVKPLRKYSEVQMKAWIEPGCVALLGVFLGAIGNEPLAVYLLIGAACQCITACVSEWQSRMLALNLKDQMFEQRMQAERFRQH